LRIVVHREVPDNPNLHRQWNAVALQTERPQVFYTYEWACSVQAAYYASLKPLLLLGYEGDHLIGVASLATDKAGKNLTFLAATTADYCDFLVAPQRSSEFAEAVFAELGKTNSTSLALANLPADSPTVDVLRAQGEKRRFNIFPRPAYLCAQVDLGSGERRQELKTSLMNKKKLRRYLREMEREGPVTFVHLQSWAEIQTALPGFADAHVARFLATGRVSSLSTPERRMFLDKLGKQFDGCGIVTLSMLKINDRPVAWNYGFQFCGSWFWYQPTFDSWQEENSPGHCLLSRIVIEACDMESMNVVDLGLGAEGYKERFGNSTRQTLYVTLTRSPLRHLMAVAKYRTANELRKSPRTESVVRRLLHRLPPDALPTPKSKNI
jgi:CelD/BcsL family acetyltransferase involved in cellulose biosynthesis